METREFCCFACLAALLMPEDLVLRGMLVCAPFEKLGIKPGTADANPVSADEASATFSSL